MQCMILLHNIRVCKAYRGAPETIMDSKLQAGEQVRWSTWEVKGNDLLLLALGDVVKKTVQGMIKSALAAG